MKRYRMDGGGGASFDEDGLWVRSKKGEIE